MVDFQQRRDPIWTRQSVHLKRLDAQGIDVVGGTAEASRVFIERQMDIWEVVKDNNIKAD